ncbi:hypothetical protein CRUP_023816, partial [Coryphaenoides rupestris]
GLLPPRPLQQGDSDPVRTHIHVHLVSVVLLRRCAEDTDIRQADLDLGRIGNAPRGDLSRALADGAPAVATAATTSTTRSALEVPQGEATPGGLLLLGGWNHANIP